MYIEKFICDVIDTVFFDYYLSCFFMRKREKWNIIGIIGVIIVTELCNVYLKNRTLALILPLAAFVLLFAYGNIFFDGKKFLKGVIVGVFYGLCNVLDCGIYVVSIIFNIDINLFYENREARIILLIIMQVLLFLTVLSFTMICRKITVKVPNVYLFLVSLFFILLIAVYSIQYSFLITADKIARFIYFAVSIIALVLILILSIRAVLSQMREREREILLKREWDIQNEFLGKVVRQYNNLRVLRHDYKNHINTMKALYDSNNEFEFNKYINEYRNELVYSLRTDICNDTVVSAIIQDKSDEAETMEKSIKWETDKDIEFKKNQREFCCCLISLVDAAIKVCEDKGQINVKIYKKEKALKLNVSCEGRGINTDNENVRKIVKKIVEDIGGKYEDMSVKGHFKIETEVEVI